MSFRRPKLERNILPLHITKLTQSFPQFMLERLRVCEAYVECAYSSQLGLLRAAYDRPRGYRAAEQRDEVASFQPIELHSNPTSHGQIVRYGTGEDQSGGSG